MNLITVKSTINAPLKKVWDYWTLEKHVINWNFAAADWHCPNASNNLTVGGEFHYTMAAKDNSFSFDFWGTHKKIEVEKTIESIIGDGRHMMVTFEATNEGTIVIENFEPESQNPPERQQMGWQMILDNFKAYVEKS